MKSHKNYTIYIARDIVIQFQKSYARATYLFEILTDIDHNNISGVFCVDQFGWRIYKEIIKGLDLVIKPHNHLYKPNKTNSIQLMSVIDDYTSYCIDNDTVPRFILWVSMSKSEYFNYMAEYLSKAQEDLFPETLYLPNVKDAKVRTERVLKKAWKEKEIPMYEIAYKIAMKNAKGNKAKVEPSCTKVYQLYIYFEYNRAKMMRRLSAETPFLNEIAENYNRKS